jgi:DNA invertase Pin-like site-specific DNA recombinase
VQQFNTTTSMGRLTLNVLLSFAQFEREVIGERVRDKLAASAGAVKLSRRFRRRNIPNLPLLPTGPQINLLKYNRTIQMTCESAKSLSARRPSRVSWFPADGEPRGAAATWIGISPPWSYMAPTATCR